jgi:hypothetical protein
VSFGGTAKARREQLALSRVHQRHEPRSRSRRAMILRWISAVPP